MKKALIFLFGSALAFILFALFQFVFIFKLIDFGYFEQNSVQYQSMTSLIYFFNWSYMWSYGKIIFSQSTKKVKIYTSCAVFILTYVIGNLWYFIDQSIEFNELFSLVIKYVLIPITIFLSCSLLLKKFNSSKEFI